MTESMIQTQFAFITCSSWGALGFYPSLPAWYALEHMFLPHQSGTVMRSKSTEPGQ